MPPQPYIAHEYTLLANQKGLIGRTEELSKLTNWVLQTEFGVDTPVLCVVAIGGMGKSALTWHWATTIAPDLTTDGGGGFLGSIWWSFYESGATYQEFIVRSLAYVSGIPIKVIVEKSLPECEDALIRIINNRPFLIVLDGLERILNAYADPASLYRRDEELSVFERDARPRQTIDINAGRFLRRLVKINASRILISSRLYPSALEDVAGQPIKGTACLQLGGLSERDALSLWESFGLFGTSVALSAFFSTFERHPLLIQAMASVVARDRRANGDYDIWKALNPGFDVFTLPIKQVRTHILDLAMQGLSERESYTLHVIATVRRPIAFKTLSSLLVGGEDRQFPNEISLIGALERLEQSGLLG